MSTNSKPNARVVLLGLPDAFLLEAVQTAEPQVTAVAVNSRVANRAPEFGAADSRNPPFGFARIHEVLRTATKIACC